MGATDVYNTTDAGSPAEAYYGYECEHANDLKYSSEHGLEYDEQGIGAVGISLSQFENAEVIKAATREEGRIKACNLLSSKCYKWGPGSVYKVVVRGKANPQVTKAVRAKTKAFVTLQKIRQMESDRFKKMKAEKPANHWVSCTSCSNIKVKLSALYKNKCPLCSRPMLKSKLGAAESAYSSAWNVKINAGPSNEFYVYGGCVPR